MGMREEVVENILTDNSKVPKHGSGVGVINVHNRIQLMFGEEYGLKVESEADEGTKVTIHIPAIPFNSENQSKNGREKCRKGRAKNEKRNKSNLSCYRNYIMCLALFFTFKMFDQIDRKESS